MSLIKVTFYEPPTHADPFRTWEGVLNSELVAYASRVVVDDDDEPSFTEVYVRGLYGSGLELMRVLQHPAYLVDEERKG